MSECSQGKPKSILGYQEGIIKQTETSSIPEVREPNGKRQSVNELKLIVIGDANWDLYANDNGVVWSIPKPQHPDCKSSWYGDKYHLLKLMRRGDTLGKITEDGLEFLSGLHHQLMPDFHWLKFN